MHPVNFAYKLMCVAAGAEEAQTKAKKARKKADVDSDDDPWHKFTEEDVAPVSPLSPGKVGLHL